MCGRYASTLPPDAIARLFLTVNSVPNHSASWNVAPSDDALVVRRHPETGERHLSLLTWGLVPAWTKDLASARRPINARAETVVTSRMFHRAFATRRCLVPADAFYEWKSDGPVKQPYAVARRDGQPMAFAGLWEGWRGPAGDVLRTFTIITTDANPVLAPIHRRMPVVVEPTDWPAWLGETGGDPVALMRPAADEVLKAWPVSTRVNNVRNDGPDLVAAA
jgi:putative SOS response-associated peptidase YedK